MISIDISHGLVLKSINQHDATTRLTHPRSDRPGQVHVSTIIKHAALMLGIIKDESEDEESLIYTDGGLVVKPESLNRICLGLAWEEWLAKHVVETDPNIEFHPGEFQLDGIVGSPDCLEISNDYCDRCGVCHPATVLDGCTFRTGCTPIVSEFKLTWKTARRYDDWMWMCQIKAYCTLLSTRYAKLHVMFVNSDYKPPMPSYRVWSLEFTQLELDENWRMLVTHGRKHCGLKTPGLDKAIATLQGRKSR